MEPAGAFQVILQGGSFALIAWIIYSVMPKYLENLNKITSEFRTDMKEARDESREDREEDREVTRKLSEAVHDIGSRIALHNEQFHNPRNSNGSK